MTEEKAPVEAEDEPATALPGWVPVLIGVVLLGMAALAVFTGLRYHESATFAPLLRGLKPAPVSQVNSPPGEPQPGASLVYPGDADNVPEANAPVTNHTKATITGGSGAVSSVVRLWARRAMILQIVPADALVYVNNLAIGQADQFSSMDQAYDFPAAGSYTVRVTAPGYRDRIFVVTAAENAKEEIARITARLDPAK